jgi:DNA-binding MarR family transcriptional regulator
MSKPLSEREKLVLHAIVRSPRDTDRELADAIGLKQTTLTAIRRRLHSGGWYSLARIPSVRELGGELFAATYCHYRATVPLNIRLITGRRLVKMHGEVFWAGSEYSQAVSFQFAKNFTGARANVVEMERLYTAQGFLGEGGITFLTFPFGIASFPFFFDYEPLLRQSFGLEGDGKPSGFPRGRKAAEFTSAGRKVYHGLVENPELNDRELAARIGVSQRTVAKLRCEFEDDGLYKTVAVPDLLKLDFRMLALDHAKLNLRIQERQRKEILDALVSIRPPILLATSGDDVVALTAYEDFGVYRRCINSFSEVYKQDDIFVKEPKRMLFSIPEMEMLKSHAYGSGVARMLGLS